MLTRCLFLLLRCASGPVHEPVTRSVRSGTLHRRRVGQGRKGPSPGPSARTGGGGGNSGGERGEALVELYESACAAVGFGLVSFCVSVGVGFRHERRLAPRLHLQLQICPCLPLCVPRIKSSSQPPPSLRTIHKHRRSARYIRDGLKTGLVNQG